MIFLFVAALFPSSVLALTPNDPQVNQWSYRDTKAFEAWDRATGSPEVVVAVIDNGFDTFHPELTGNAWKNTDEIPENGIDDDGNGYIDDVWGWNFVGVDRDGDGGLNEEEIKGDNDPRPDVIGITPEEIADGSVHHGTLVAGIIGAVANNNLFGAGIAWKVRLMNVKVVGNSGNIAIARLAQAISYAVDNGADIINISLVGPPDQQELKEALRYAHEKGVAVIAAAGNDYLSLDEYPKYPLCADEEGDAVEEWVLGVSGIDEAHHLAQFSNRGHCIDITAPAVHISSTMRYAPRYGLDMLYGGPWSGTSFAAPFVSGAAALVKSIHPEWKAKEIFETILSTVHKTPPPDEAEYAKLFGAGLVQINRAVEAALLKVVGFHPLKDVLAYAPISGVLAPSSMLAPKGAQAIAAYTNGSARGFVGVFPKTWNTAAVVLFDEAWRETGRFIIPRLAGVSLAVGDVMGDGAPEILIAPRAASKTVFRVYALDGRELRAVTIAAAHSGATIGLIDTKQKKREVVAVYGGRLYRYTDAFVVANVLHLPHVKNMAPVAAGDIDGDGEQEYVVGAGPGDEAKLAYYEEDGRWLRTFLAYNGGYRGGLDVAVGDYDLDGKDDAVVAAVAGGQPIRVWTSRSRRIAEWWPFGEGSKTRMMLVPRYK